MEKMVAPRAGAWIETRFGHGEPYPNWVAPRAGAWIETLCATPGPTVCCPSRPVRARGLKQLYGAVYIARHMSRPVRARGLKLH